MRSICLFVTILWVTFTNCEKSAENPDVAKWFLHGIAGENNGCNCRCSIQEDKGVVNNEKNKIIPDVTACPQSEFDPDLCFALCTISCTEMANGPYGITYGYKRNLYKGVTCLHDNTTKKYDYSNCTNYKNTMPSGSLTDGCKDYCKGNVDLPESDLLCLKKTKSSNGTVSDGTKRCNCKCMKQEDKNNPLVITACPQNFDKVECEKFCTSDCPKLIKSNEACQDIYGFTENDQNGITCIHDGKTEKKYEFDNCTNYKNAIPSQSLTEGCKDYCAGTAQFPKSKVICTVKREVGPKKDEL